MRYFLNFLFTLVLHAFICLSANAQIVCDQAFLREYSAEGNIEPIVTKVLDNGEVLLAGKGTQTETSLYKAMAVKLSSTGSVAWSILAGGDQEASFTGVIVLSNGSYLFYGTTTSFGYSEGKVFMANISSNGNLNWTRLLGIPGSTGERIKAMTQFSDGDLIGTFNINDSTPQSTPVVFKVNLNGMFKWVEKFDNNSTESFTSLGYDKTTIYVSGFYTDTHRRGAILLLDSENGTLISSKKITMGNETDEEEITNLEVYGGNISYALSINNVNQDKMMLVHTDLKDNIIYSSFINNWDAKNALFTKRTPDGFLVLNQGTTSFRPPYLLKLNNSYGKGWTSFLSESTYYRYQVNSDADFTQSGGAVSAGYYPTYTNTGRKSKMVVTRLNAKGESGTCIPYGNSLDIQPGTFQTSNFSWAKPTSITGLTNRLVPPTFSTLKLDENIICEKEYCIDTTPLPPGCNKTSLIEYFSLDASILRDFVRTDDGGKIAVGDTEGRGLIVKYKENGDVEWSKIIADDLKSHIVHRIIKGPDNTYIAFTNTFYTLDHYSYGDFDIIKFDSKGNSLYSRNLQFQTETSVSDVFATRDGGFVLVANGSYGYPPLYSYVIRMDADLKIIWNKEIIYDGINPVYRSVFCTDDAVYLAHDHYGNYNQTMVGLQKLDYKTGNNIWSNRYEISAQQLNINKLILDNDTLYAFLNNSTYDSDFRLQKNIFLLKVINTGKPIEAIAFETDRLKNVEYPYYFNDAHSSTVTITPDKDFVMSNQMITSNGTQLNISRFDKNGKPLWSKNYPDLREHYVYNIHAEGKGFSIIGTVHEPGLRDLGFTNSFLLKVDSSGEISENTTGNCATELSATDFKIAPLTIQETDSRIQSVVDTRFFKITAIETSFVDVPYNATLFCHQKSTCQAVKLGAGETTSCATSDTLVYYLQNNLCGAIARWKYDTGLFYLVSATTDTLKLIPLKPTRTYIYATIEDDCTSRTDSVFTSVPLKASTLNLGADSTICAGSSLDLKAGPFLQSYLWNDGSTDSIRTISSPGIYYVKVTDVCGGVATDTIKISFIEDPFKLAGATEKCNSDTVTLQASAGYSNYQWQPSPNIPSNNTEVRVNPFETTMYHVSAKNSLGCFVQDSLLLTVKTSPGLHLGNDTTLCYNEGITLTVPTGFTTYSWSNGETTPSTTVSQSGTYFLSAVYPNHCISKDTIDIKNYAFSSPELGQDISFCSGVSIRFNPGNFQTYEWSTGNTEQFITADTKGMYWVKVTDQNNCVGSDTIYVRNVYESPSDFLPVREEICFGDATVLKTSKPFTNYQWSTGAGINNISVNEVGVYKLLVTDQNGCTGIDSTIVAAKQDCPADIYFFDAFTPNQDRLNDLFKPIVKGRMTKYSFTIYDRFGQIVFSSKDPSHGWDGTLKGALSPGGAYVYSCGYQFPGFPEMVKHGQFVLIR